MQNIASRVAAISLAVGLLSCTRSPSLDTRTFELQYLEGGTAAQMIEPYVYGDRPEGNRGMISLAGNLITVRETPDNLDKIARVLEQYDKPSPMAQLRFKIIEADGAAQTDSAIADVESALRSLFRFRGYRLLAEAVLGGLEGSEVQQEAAGGDRRFGIRAHIQDIRGVGDSSTVRMEVGMWDITGRPLLETTVSVRTGQTVVLGSTQSRSSGPTLILAVQAELVNP
jgi:type II secretory pathway component GspD/PulD (secretin)